MTFKRIPLCTLVSLVVQAVTSVLLAIYFPEHDVYASNSGNHIRQ